MIFTLICKDMRLLQHYVISAITITLACYLTTAIGVTWLTTYQEENMQVLPVRSFLILRGGHQLGFCFTALCSVMLAGSVFTLERADRSAEFLACLPPRRYQHLIGKFTVLFGVTTLMIAVHVTATLASDWLLPYVRATGYPFSEGTQLSAVFMFVAVIMAMVGGALAVSAWQKSNGVPILCGLLTPLLLLSLFQLVSYLLDLPESPGLGQSNRFAVTLFVTGAFLTYCGAYWYVGRVEP